MRDRVKEFQKNTRLISALLDHVVMTLVFGVFALPELVYRLIISTKHSVKLNDMGQLFFYIMVTGYAAYLCKDCIGGRSLAKRVLKFQIVNYKTGLIASPLRCFLRNISLVLLPVEAIVIFISPTRRIGDLIAGTTLISSSEPAFFFRPQYLQIFFSMVLAYIFSLSIVLMLR
jgi:uncharacterized RDD family membrane protein YckC